MEVVYSNNKDYKSVDKDIIGIVGDITFLDKYNPEQFEIIWRGGDIEWAEK